MGLSLKIWITNIIKDKRKPADVAKKKQNIEKV